MTATALPSVESYSGAESVAVAKADRSTGFSLIELAVVLLIAALLLSSVGVPYYQQLQQQRAERTSELLIAISGTIEGFFAANSRLPCPASVASAGVERFANARCESKDGFVPATSLGINGRRNADGLLVDHYGGAIRYSVSAYGNWLWFDPPRISSSTYSYLQADLQVCAQSGCRLSDGGLTLTANAPFVLLSLAVDSSLQSRDHSENAGEQFVQGRLRYGLNADTVFVSRPLQTQPAENAFDDLLHWVPVYRLHRLLIELR